MDTLMYIHWNPDPVIFSIGGFPLRWYSFFWFVGLVISMYVLNGAFKRVNSEKGAFDKLFIYSFIGIFVGARLGHCLFYEPDYFLAHPLEMILPFKINNGVWTFTGYAGLASHGGTIGIIVALILFCRKTGMHYLDVMDLVALVAPIASGFIRIANLMNSEIIGNVTTVPWAFVFESVDMMPRHPAQLYEAIAYFVMALLILYLYKYQNKHLGRGFLFGLCIAMIFTFRFFIEFIKEDQVAFENGMLLNMGQLLSIPFIIIGCWFAVKGWRKNN